MAFGKTAADYETDREETGGDGEIWIRRFQNPSTVIRIAPYAVRDERGRKQTGTNAWMTAREHFDPNLKLTFPCLADEGEECGGCASSNDRVRKRSRRYYFPALDDQGAMRVWKMGRKLYLRLQAREQRLAAAERPTTLSDRDYTIIKTGQGLETEYEIEPGEVYEVDWRTILNQDPIPDIAAILEGLAAQARKHYKTGPQDDIDPEDEAEEEGALDDDLDEPVRPAKKAAAKTAVRRPEPQDDVDDEEEAPAPRKTAAKKTAARRPAPEPEDEVVDDDEEEAPAPRKTAAKKAAAKAPAVDDVIFESYEDVENAKVEDLRYYLEQNEVEFPARAPRGRLVKMVADYIGLEQEPPY